MSAAAMAAMFGALIVSASAQTAAPKTVAKTEWGAPDLRGVWDFRTITPLERPERYADREFLTEAEAAKLEQDVVTSNEEQDVRPAQTTTSGGNVDRRADGTPGFYNNFWLDGGTKTVGTRRTSLIIDPPNGKVPPMTEDGRKRAAARQAHVKEHPADSWLDRSASDRCLVGFNAGPPLSPGGYNQNLHVFQTKDYVALQTEMIHTVRIVPLDGRPRLNNSIRQWSGDARGHWEGDTLVVETTNFNEERRWRNASASLKLVERFRRLDAQTLEYTYTVIDPDTWTKPWTAQIPLRIATEPLYEYACHEGNYSMEGILSGARSDEAAAPKR